MILNVQKKRYLGLSESERREVCEDIERMLKSRLECEREWV
jgi:hypothetical protein